MDVKFNHRSSQTFILPLSQLLLSPAVRAPIQDTLGSLVLCSLGVPDPVSTSRQLVSLASGVCTWEESELCEFESQAHACIFHSGFKSSLAENLHKRTEMVSKQLLEIWPPNSTGKLCDYGCGDGKHGKALQALTSMDVSYADVARHPALNGSEFMFDVISEENPGGVYEAGFFDHVMAGCVGHHTRCPKTFLSNLSRITRKGGKVALVESVFGTRQHCVAVKGSRNEKLVETEAIFKGLSKEQQLSWLVFFDYFYNRVIHYTSDKSRKIPMGLSYGTPESWIDEAGKVGLEHVTTHFHGVDRCLVPVYHLTHVFKGTRCDL